MNPSEIKYTINDITIETSKILGIPYPKLIFENGCDGIYVEYGIKEIHIDENSILDLDNIYDLLTNLFESIYYLYEQDVVKDFSYLEKEETRSLWKNELIRDLMNQEKDFLLDINISQKAFSLFMLQKLFGIKKQETNEKINNKLNYFINRYI